MGFLKRSVFTLSLMTTGCGIIDSEDSRMKELQHHRRVWEAESIDEYSFDFRAGCNCSSRFHEWVTVQVDDDSIESVVLREEGVAIEHESIDRWLTVAEMFAQIESTLRNKPEVFEAQYDTALGHPTLFQKDGSRQASDDEYFFVVEDLSVISRLP